MRISDFSPDEFAAYLAGFIDGEGCITTYPNRFHVECCVANTHLGVLEQIRERLGCGSIAWQQQQPHHQRRYALRFKNVVDCETLLVCARRFMTIKAAKAAEALTVLAEGVRLESAMNERDKTIREASAAGAKGRDLAKRFGLSPQSVSRILRGHEWPALRKPIGAARGTRGASRPNRAAISFLPGAPTTPFPSDRADLSAMPDNVFAAYLAALIDGEGTVSTRYGKTQVLITNTDLSVLKAIKARSGIGAIQHKTPVPGEKPSYRWAVENAGGCLAILAQIIQFLQIKHSNAVQVMARCEEVAKEKNRILSVHQTICEMALQGKRKDEIASALGVSLQLISRHKPKGHVWPTLLSEKAKARPRDKNKRFVSQHLDQPPVRQP